MLMQKFIDDSYNVFANKKLSLEMKKSFAT